MANTLPCALAVLAISLFGNALFGGFYHIIRATRSILRMLLSVGIYITAFAAGHNAVFAETLSSIMPVIMGISAIIIAIVFLDLAKMVKKDKNRRGARRRHTPAHN